MHRLVHRDWGSRAICSIGVLRCGRPDVMLPPHVSHSRRMFRIVPAEFGDSRVVDLLTTHMTRARAETARGSAHALDLAGLQVPAIRVWTIWREETLYGVGALKRLSAEHGEVKSMHTLEALRGRGAGSAMLLHLIERARTSGMRHLSLETGSWDYFLAARALYHRHGFVECAPFADYVPDPNSVFLSLAL